MSSGDDFQSGNVGRGRAFRDRCKEVLQECGFSFEREDERFDFGVHVDLVYGNAQDSSFFIQVCGTIEDEPTGSKPGLERSDSVRKIICDAFLLSKEAGWPTLVMTSHTPVKDSVPAKLLNFAGRNVVFDVLSIGSETDLETLRRYARMDSDELSRLSQEINREIL